MSIAEMLPEVRSLSRGDKLKLIQLLAQELERDETEMIESGRDYPDWGAVCGVFGGPSDVGSSG